jgi:plasmid stabilization system protein ParE
VRRVVWSESALSDFCEVLEYIAADDVRAAEQVAERIEQAIETLVFMPTGRKGRVGGTYEKVVTGLPYIVAYALSEERSGEERLTVLRIIHGARHWPSGEWPGDS